MRFNHQNHRINTCVYSTYSYTSLLTLSQNTLYERKTPLPVQNMYTTHWVPRSYLPTFCGVETFKKIFLIPCKSFSVIRQNDLHFGGYSSSNFRGISALMNWRICRLIFGIFRLFPLILKGFIIEQETWEKIKQKCQLITKKLCTYSRTQPLGTEVKVGGHLYSSLCTLSLGIVLFWFFF